MVPLAASNLPPFRAFRLLRVGSFVTGEWSAQVVLSRHRAALVEEVTGRVLLRILGIAESVAARRAYL